MFFARSILNWPSANFWRRRENSEMILRIGVVCSLPFSLPLSLFLAPLFSLSLPILHMVTVGMLCYFWAQRQTDEKKETAIEAKSARGSMEVGVCWLERLLSLGVCVCEMSLFVPRMALLSSEKKYPSLHLEHMENQRRREKRICHDEMILGTFLAALNSRMSEFSKIHPPSLPGLLSFISER